MTAECLAISNLRLAKCAQAIPAVVRMFSGCKDAQTSADVFDTSTFALPEDAGPGGAGGACTNAMLSCLLRSDAEGKRLTWLELLEGMRTILSQKNFTQASERASARKPARVRAFTRPHAHTLSSALAH
eukprot:6201642-Pleurochrysis_carterae.AAC.5